MARKETEKSLSPMALIDTPPLEAKSITMTAMVEVPVVDVVGYCPRNFHFAITHTLAKSFKMLKDGLHTTGATYHDGSQIRHVDSDADAFRWLLAQLECS